MNKDELTEYKKIGWRESVSRVDCYWHGSIEWTSIRELVGKELSVPGQGKLEMLLFASIFIHLFFSDYVSGGELFTHLYQRERFQEDEVRLYIGEIILALEHLHKVSTVLLVRNFLLTKIACCWILLCCVLLYWYVMLIAAGYNLSWYQAGEHPPRLWWPHSFNRLWS